MNPHDTVAAVSTDAALASTAITSPLWLQLVDKGLTTYMVGAGAVLLTLRCLKTYREWKLARQTYLKGTDDGKSN